MIFNSGRVATNRIELEALLLRLATFEFDGAAAIEYGQVRTELQRAGRPIPAIDTMIAAIARIHGATVLSADRHFSEILGLTTENWL